MRKLFILAFCCMSIVYAGLKEDIEEKFNECMSASDYAMHDKCDDEKAGCYLSQDEYGMPKYKSYTEKEYCFSEFSKKYADILMKQCENKKKDECKKLAYVISGYHIDYIEHTQPELKKAMNHFATFCSSTECYEIAELFGLTHKISQPFLEKACKENVDDACYAIGK